MRYFGGCDVGSTYTKCVILDENGNIAANVTNRSKINPVQSAEIALEDAVAQINGLNSAKELTYLIGTGYGRNKVPFADENISEISCHAMGVHVTNPEVKAIIDIGGQDVKGISIDTDGTVKNFAMNDKCAAGTGRFYEAMANAFEMTLPEFSKLSLNAKNTIPITAQCTVFAESEVISLVGEGKPMDEIAAGIQLAVAKRCFVMAKKAGECQTIARVRNPEYRKTLHLFKEDLGLAMIINPEYIAATEMARILRFPSAIEIDTFAKGRVEILKFKVREDSVLDGLKLLLQSRQSLVAHILTDDAKDHGLIGICQSQQAEGLAAGSTAGGRRGLEINLKGLKEIRIELSLLTVDHRDQ